MLYIILLCVFGAILAIIYFVSGPIQAAMKRNVFRQKEHVARELEQMFIFISVDGLQKIKWALAFIAACIGLVFAWDFAPPGPIVVAAILGAMAYWGPEIFILYLRRKRRAAFSEQLVDALVMMSNGMRSGFTLQQAI